MTVGEGFSAHSKSLNGLVDYKIGPKCPLSGGNIPLREIAYGTVGSFETPNQELQRLRKVALAFRATDWRSRSATPIASKSSSSVGDLR